uniref:Uncharacterized protein n=1 Tax=Klebsiella pneumoniae TaxID=573 RepID=A0A8B0SYN9_KLEPN|nr:hypothetical protein [Klebsiella pneumoniae]
MRGVIGVCWRSLNIVSSIPPHAGGIDIKKPQWWGFLLCAPTSRWGLFTIKESYFLQDNPHSVKSCRLQSAKALRR